MDAMKLMEIMVNFLLMIFRKFEVDKEFDALGVDIAALLNSLITKE